jgi:CTP:phosphocholine cytidylyltransferase-like protein
VITKFSEDSYDKIAFSYGEVRGSVNLVYNDAYQEYFAFLTVFIVTCDDKANLKFGIPHKAKL